MTNVPELLNQAFAEYRAGRSDRAEALLRQAAADNNPQAQHALAGLLLETGRAAEALSFAKAAAAKVPGQPQVQFQLAQCYAANDDIASAIKAAQTLVRLDSHNPEAYLHLGLLYHRLPDLAKAGDAYRQALHYNPDFIPALNNLAALHRESGNLTEAASLADKVLRLDSHNANALNNLGIVHIERNAMKTARECFMRALDMDGNNPEFLHNLGLCDAAEGKFAAARENFEKALAQAPQRTDILRDLFQVTAPAEHGRLVKRLEGYRSKIDVLRSEQRADVFFSLATAYANTDRPDDAFAMYRDANEARQRSRWPDVDIRREQENLECVQQAFDSALIDANRNVGPDDELPVFILGMPRSGTTLVDQVLSSHPQCCSAGELTLFEDIAKQVLGGKPGTDHAPNLKNLDAANLQKIAETYLDGLSRYTHGPATRVTDKQLINFRYLGLIAQALPGARIIHCQRDARDTCLSCFFTDFQQWHYYSSDLESLGRFYNIYQQYMAHWTAVLNDRFMTVQYEELVGDFEAQARRLVGYCGLEWDPACLDFEHSTTPAKTASYYQVRQKPHQRAIGRYRRYESHIGPLLELLGN